MAEEKKDDRTTAQWAIDEIAGTYSNVAEAAERLKLAAKHCHLIGGASIMPDIEGHDIQITVIPINKADAYPIKVKEGDPPRKGIPGYTIFQLANALQVEWTSLTRVDDRSIANYAEHEAVGRYKALDGTYRIISDRRDSDLRDGSLQILNKKEGEVSALRANLDRSGITKAQLRALRKALGVAQGMLETELEKPFVVARAIFTGRSNDAATRRMFAQVIALKELAGTAALYGGNMPALQLPTMQEEPKRITAHVVTTDGEVIDAPAPKPAPARPVAPPPAAPAPAQSAPRSNGGNGGNGKATWPWEPRNEGDPKKGTPFEQVDTAALERLAKYCENQAAKGGQYADSDAARAKAARAVIAARNAPQGQGVQTPPPAAQRQREPGDDMDEHPT